MSLILVGVIVLILLLLGWLAFSVVVQLLFGYALAYLGVLIAKQLGAPKLFGAIGMLVFGLLLGMSPVGLVGGLLAYLSVKEGK